MPIWDLPVRLGHWAVVLLVAFSWVTGTYGALTWHRWSGYTILVLVLFRVYWGFAGSRTARFAHFLCGPRAVWRYSKTLLTRLGGQRAGHTPLGGWNILAMLLLLLAQSALGLFAVDVDGIESGPLSDLVSFETGRVIAAWHSKILMDLLLVLIALHLVAILYYWLYKGDNLILAMLSGVKRLPPGTPAPIPVPIFWRALVGLAAVALVVMVVVSRLGFN